MNLFEHLVKTFFSLGHLFSSNPLSCKHYFIYLNTFLNLSSFSGQNSLKIFCLGASESSLGKLLNEYVIYKIIFSSTKVDLFLVPPNMYECPSVGIKNYKIDIYLNICTIIYSLNLFF